MFPRSLKLFTLLGFRVSVDASWLFLAVLVTWTLAVGYFPAAAPDLDAGTYWWMAVFGALGLFASIVFHEFAHALVARRYDMPIKGITLFIFGGVAEMVDEPTSARAEFWVAIAGPVASFALALGFFVVGGFAAGLGAGLPVVAALGYLAWINFILALFNLAPAFPLDGGRVLRAAAWGWTGRFRRATQIAAASGAVFAYLLMGLGLLSVVTGNLIGGIWWFLIGMFVRAAASQSHQQAVMREVLSGVPLKDLARRDAVSVAPELSISELVEDYFYTHHYKSFPVVDGDRLVGCVDLDSVKRVPREEWAATSVGAVAAACSPENTVDPGTDVYAAMRKMMSRQSGWLLLAEGDRLVGIVSQSDITRYLAIRLDLEETETKSAGSGERQAPRQAGPGGRAISSRRV